MSAVLIETAHCILCGAEEGREILREGDYRLYDCDCGAAFTAPYPELGVVDLTADFHGAGYYSESSDYKLNWLAQSHPGGTLLEIGCGTGIFLQAARARGYEVMGMEPHPQRADHVRQLGIPVFDTFVEVSEPETRFEIVYHHDLLSHFPDPHLALRKMSAHLAPGGVLFFEVGLVAGRLSPFWSGMEQGLGLPQHRWFYNQTSLNKLFESNGLRVVRSKAFGLGPTKLIFHLGRRIKRLVKGSPKSSTPQPFDHLQQQDRHTQRARFLAFCRYRLGSLFPYLGPGTAFYMLQKREAS